MISSRPENDQAGLPKLKAAGVLLAGGKGLRMNTNKAFLELGGRPLIECSLAVLQTVFAEVLISSNEREAYAGYGLPVIPDENPESGPLEGLCRSLKAATFDTVFIVACDMPFLNAKLIRRLAKWSLVYDIVIPSFKSGPEAGLHPLHAFYHRRCLPVIEKNLSLGKLKIRDLFPFCSVGYIGETELRDFTNLSQIFSNVNTWADWSEILKEQVGQDK